MKTVFYLSEPTYDIHLVGNHIEQWKIDLLHIYYN